MDLPTFSQWEEPFNQLADNIRDVLWLYAADYGEVLYISPAYERVWGRTRESLYRDPYSFLDAVHPEDRIRVETTIRAEHVRGFDLQYRIVRPDGIVRWIWDRGFPVRDQAGRVYRVAGIAEDITERRQADEKLRRVSERLQLATTAARIGIWDWDVLKDELVWDETMYRLYGIRKEDFRGARDAWAKSLAANDRDQENVELQAAFRGEREYAPEFRIVWPDGSIHFIKAAARIFRDEERRPVRMVGLNYDITEHKRAEEKLRWSEERLRLLLDSTAEGLFGVDLEGRCTFCNASSLRLLGYDRPSELLGKDMHALIAHSRADGTPYPREECPVVQSLQDATSLFVETDVFWRRDGISFPAQYWAYPIFHESKHIGAVVTFLDITERKLADESLRLSEERFAKAFQASPEAITIFRHRDGVLLEVNERWQSVYGYSRDEAVGHTSLGLNLIKPEDRARLRGLLEKQHSVREFEVDLRTKQNEIRHISLAAEQIVINNELCNIFLHRDITERKQVEEKLVLSTEQLRALSARLQSAREEEGTRIAREIHDELGSLLASLRWDLEGLATGFSESGKRLPVPEVRKKIADMLGLTDKTIGIVRRIASDLRPSVLDVLGLVEAIQWQAREFQDRTGILVYCDCPSDNVHLNQEQSTAVFRIFQESLTNTLRHAQATRVDVTMVEGIDALTLTIRDNGRGITEKEKSGQSSIGIVGMRERAHLIGGELDIAGAEGEGTTVTVRIPLARSEHPLKASAN